VLLERALNDDQRSSSFESTLAQNLRNFKVYLEGLSLLDYVPDHLLFLLFGSRITTKLASFWLARMTQ
jgi:hypothetical protein